MAFIEIAHYGFVHRTFDKLAETFTTFGEESLELVVAQQALSARGGPPAVYPGVWSRSGRGQHAEYRFREQDARAEHGALRTGQMRVWETGALAGPRLVIKPPGDKAGRWKAWYREAIPLAEQRYETYLKERQGEEEGRR